MIRASLALCAIGGFLLGLIGCNALDVALVGATPGAEVAAEYRVIDGSPENAALVLQTTLKSRGLETNIVRDNGLVVVESKTAGGLRFGLMLKSQPGPSGQEQTHVSLEWLGSGKDQQTSVQIFAEIDKQGTTR